MAIPNLSSKPHEISADFAPIEDLSVGDPCGELRITADGCAQVVGVCCNEV